MRSTLYSLGTERVVKNPREKNYYGDQVNDDELGGAYSTQRRNGKCTQTFCRKIKLKGRDHLGYRSIV
jgi:hypothetical protein